jgi:hypothetical protein
MTPGGWINLTLSLGFVLGLLGWCCWKLLRSRPEAQEDDLADLERDHGDEPKDR